ncbi:MULTISPECIES: helix-turn-helix transcriptional regulator [unclassified Micromonospora]|uniref:helix-turn-helix domain-containing protein n=1 Tax=unclassified Micromonospora TaxID=2617518 RepID=UPI0022B6FBF8|nr:MULTISPECIES: helix-turn-helix transcriptional regulator [unclassified Micromonospora]MCZ7422794.1 helix-turn-helix transcriptional regulator [Verrucosispora sp. WMMA2121]WBB90532.1 helix-turn-helix transcriptional regulator [Verrucosispora sp. WMMC514]
MDSLPELTFGQRLKVYRERSGKTRAVLGGLVGRSAEWVKAVETDRILPPRLHMMDRIARALKIDVSALAVELGDRSAVVNGPEHPALASVRDAVNRVAFAGDAPAESLSRLRERLAVAWRARHQASDHRTVLGGLLPGLLRDVQRAVLVYEGDDRRQAQALLAETLGLAQMFIAYQPAAELLWRVADRAMVAAQESGDPEAVAGAGWFLCQVHRDAGDWDTAMAVTLDVLSALESQAATGSTNLLALWGALNFEAAYTAARAGEEGRAWRYWDRADRVAQRLPESFYQPQTSFSRVIMGAHAVTVAVELQKSGEAVRQARRHDTAAIPSRPRRARHLIEVARAHYGKDDPEATVATLRQAYESAPETIRFNGYARQITLDLLDGPRATRDDARDLAVRVGLVS